MVRHRTMAFEVIEEQKICEPARKLVEVGNRSARRFQLGVQRPYPAHRRLDAAEHLGDGICNGAGSFSVRELTRCGRECTGGRCDLWQRRTNGGWREFVAERTQKHDRARGRVDGAQGAQREARFGQQQLDRVVLGHVRGWRYRRTGRPPDPGAMDA